MEIKVASIFVDNQDQALKFYTEILGFTMAPMDYGSGVKFAIFDDTCGNLVQIIERKKLEK